MKNEDKERIEIEAREYCSGSSEYIFEYRGYIAGATAERNKAIDECIAIIVKHPQINQENWPDVKKIIESLKIK